MDRIILVNFGLIVIVTGRTKATIDCNFDNDLCEWHNKADSCFNWTIGNGKTGDKTSGPIADHTTGSSNGSYALIYGRRSHNSSCSAVIQSPSFHVTENNILSFWYHMNGNGIGSLNVYLISKHTRQRIWRKNGRQSPNWLLANIHVSPGESKIEIEATAKYHFGSDLAVDDITLRKAPPSLPRTTTTLSPTTIQIAALPINCNFEDGLCGFRTDNSNFSSASWTRKSGTESLGKFTFLHGDNTTGSGSYLSLTIDNKRALIADRASLYIPAIRSQKMVCLTFAYSLPSHTSGVIQIFQTGTTTGNATLMKQLSGYHGLHWRSTFVQFLPSFEPMKIVIEGYYSGEPGCVVTLDDIHLVEGICDVQESKSTTRVVTTTFRPITKTSPAIVFNKTSSCPSEYFGLLNECDFTSNFCNYTTINSPIHWQRMKGAGGSWIARIPERKNTLSGYYLTLNISTYAVRHGEGILKTPEINHTSVCLEFSYSLPGTTSGIKVEIETSGGHTETIWQKSGMINSGKWSTKALVINRNDRYKILFSAYKNSSLSYVGIDDIHIYGKSETLTSSSVGVTAFVTNLSSPTTKVTGWITTPRLKTTITQATKLITEKSTEQMPKHTTVQQTYISPNWNPTGTHTSSNEHQISSTASSSTQIITSSSVSSTAFVTQTTTLKVMKTSTLKPPNTDHTTEAGTEISTKDMSKQTTVQSTHMSPKWNFTNKFSASSKQSISPSTLFTLSTKTMPIQTTVQQTHMSANWNFTNKPSTSTEHSMSPSTLFTISSKHVTKKKPTLELKKTTHFKFDIKSTNQRSTSNIKQVTKKTPSTKNIKATKADASKSKHLSKGAQAGIGVTVSVVGIGLVLTFIFLMKKKFKTIGINDKTNQKNVNKSNNDKQTVMLYMNVLPKGRVDHIDNMH